MSAVTENDLKRLEDLIIASRDENRQIRDEIRQSREENRQKLATLEAGIIAVQKEVSDLRVSVGKIEGSLQNQQPLVQKIPDLAEKVGELKNWRQLVIIALTALISSSITWAIRGGTIRP